MADNAIQSFIDAYPQSDTSDSHIPVPRIHRCCCGNDSCAYLRYNQSALDGLERDVRTAAKLGQVRRMFYLFAQCGVMDGVICCGSTR